MNWYLRLIFLCVVTLSKFHAELRTLVHPKIVYNIAVDLVATNSITMAVVDTHVKVIVLHAAKEEFMLSVTVNANGFWRVVMCE